ncbi:hypothetical protein [Nocardia barduliensis]|uniref:hypothetical protein n=1 Tax=Nocardia barduliensis TaxID=2736643 RepID=UPI001FEA2148|nr:hypothetical protein [Nocardia barduliensis]
MASASQPRGASQSGGAFFPQFLGDRGQHQVVQAENSLGSSQVEAVDDQKPASALGGPLHGQIGGFGTVDTDDYGS